jgi:hypothetical protein
MINDWKSEFGTGYDVPKAVSEQLADMSWHNEMCPNFTTHAEKKRSNDHKELPRVTLWVEHPEARMRELPDAKRYLVTGQGDDFETDGVEPALTEFNRRANQLQY